MSGCRYNPGAQCANAVVLAAVEFFQHDVERELADAPSDKVLQERLANAVRLTTLLRNEMTDGGVPIGEIVDQGPDLFDCFARASILYEGKLKHDEQIMGALTALLRKSMTVVADPIPQPRSHTKH